MTEEKTSRRKFLTTGAAAIAGGAAAASFPNISVAAKTVVLKVQAAWGGGIFLEFAQDYVDRVNKMSGGSLKIDLLGVGDARQAETRPGRFLLRTDAGAAAGLVQGRNQGQ